MDINGLDLGDTNVDINIVAEGEDMNRDVTNRINSFLDEWIPPKIRDSRFIVKILFRLVIGKEYVYYMNFKQKLPNLNEKEINRYYKVLDKTFVSRETHCNKACIDRILRETEGKKILDVAAGRGFIAKTLFQKDSSLDCTVSDIVLLDKKDRIDGLKYVKASITKLPFDDNAFDTVICTHALEHIKECDLALDEIRRVCKRKLLIVLPRQREYKYTYDHINFYPYKYNVEVLMNTGNFRKRENLTIEFLSNDWMIIEEMKKQ